MFKIWQRSKYLFIKRWMCTCNQQGPPQASAKSKSVCHSFIPTMDNLPVPCGGWIGRFYQKERSYNRYLFAGIGLAMLSVAALVKTKSAWLGQNFQNICTFQYHDMARPPSKTKKKEPTDASKGRQFSRQCGIEEKSAVPFALISVMFTVASLVKFLL